MKSEPDVYSLDDLAREGVTPWTGVRNYQARNFMRDDMQPGDRVLFYHSNAKPPGVAGLGVIAGPPRPDPTAFDPQSEYFDPKSSPETPRWFLVDVAFDQRFDRFVSLEQLKADPALAGMLVTRPGQRLSIQPVDAGHFEHVLKLGGV